MILGSGASRWAISDMGHLRSYSVTLRCERSEPRRATARAVHPSRAASRPPQDDGYDQARPVAFRLIQKLLRIQRAHVGLGRHDFHFRERIADHIERLGLETQIA